jgi:hypothetical protein
MVMDSLNKNKPIARLLKCETIESQAEKVAIQQRL